MQRELGISTEQLVFIPQTHLSRMSIFIKHTSANSMSADVHGLLLLSLAAAVISYWVLDGPYDKNQVTAEVAVNLKE